MRQRQVIMWHHIDSDSNTCHQSSCFCPNLALTVWKVRLALLFCQKNLILTTACMVTSEEWVVVLQLLNNTFNNLQKFLIKLVTGWLLWKQMLRQSLGCNMFTSYLLWPETAILGKICLQAWLASGNLDFRRVATIPQTVRRAHCAWAAVINSVFMLNSCFPSGVGNFGTCQAEDV